jgi:glycosyltransferase involved in cell wall biosynthesis
MDSLPPESGDLSILMVTPRALPEIGGVQNHVYETSRRMAAAGVGVTVLTTDLTGRAPRDEVVEGVRIVRVPAHPRNRDYYFAPAIAREIRRASWDVVHCQSYHTLVPPIAMRAARRAGIPYVLTFHSGGHTSGLRTLLRGVQRRALRRQLVAAARLICVSEFERTDFSRGLRLAPQRFDVIRNGGDLPDPGRVAEPPGRFVASVGRLERYKGHHRLIGALPHLLERTPDVGLMLVGDGPYRGELEALALRLGVAHAVEFRTVAADDRLGMARLLRQASLVALLSDYESQGLAAVEAAGLGTPVLVQESTALTELAAAGWAEGVPVGAGAPHVARVIADMLERPSGDRRPARIPTWDECARHLVEVYADVAPGPAAKAGRVRPVA